jgi:hypothetical protein
MCQAAPVYHTALALLTQSRLLPGAELFFRLFPLHLNHPPGRGPPPLPYPAPFTACVPALLTLMRRFTSDSASYLRSLYNPWELAPALLHHRDRVLGKVGDWVGGVWSGVCVGGGGG